METKPYQRVWLEEAAPGETFIYKEGKAEREDVQNADIILGNVSPKLISTGDKLKWLQTDSAGVDGYIHGCLPKETVLTMQRQHMALRFRNTWSRCGLNF